MFTGDGFNFRLTEIQAALGRSQLRRLDQFLAQRERVAALYADRLSGTPGLATLPDLEELAAALTGGYLANAAPGR